MTEDTNPQQTLEDGVQPEGKGTTDVVEYTETAAALARLEFRMKDVVHDVTTTKGMDAAKKDRAELRTLRTTLDATRLQKNEDDQARIKRRNDEAKRITARIEALELPIAAQIKAELDRKEDEKIARAQRERDRLENLRQRIATIQGTAVRCIGKEAAYVREKIDLVTAMKLDDFEELTPSAVNARADTLATLQEMLTAAELAEKQAKELAEANERAAANQRENERLLAEAREREEQEQAAARARQEAADKAEAAAREAAAYERRRIDHMNACVMDAAGATADSIEGCIERFQELTVFENESQTLKDTYSRGLARLQAMLTAAQNADRLVAEAAERDRQRLEEQRQREEADRQQREEFEKRQREEREAAERKEREERAAEQAKQERIARENAEARTAAEKVAPQMLDLLFRTKFFCDRIAKSKVPSSIHIEATDLARSIIELAGDLRPVEPATDPVQQPLT